MLLFLRNFDGIFQRRVNLIMPQNITSFTPPLQKLDVTNAYIIDTWLIRGGISNDITVRDVNKKTYHIQHVYIVISYQILKY